MSEHADLVLALSRQQRIGLGVANGRRVPREFLDRIREQLAIAQSTSTTTWKN